MPSSTSSSERDPTGAQAPAAADPPQRALPSTRLGLSWVVSLLLCAAGLIGWEAYWRDFGSEPSMRNSAGLWAIQRRRIDEGEGDALVLLGSSRVLFDVQLHVWERLSGQRPIQLALEGTTPLPFLQDLANDPDFSGSLLVGVAPDVFFSGFRFRGDALDHYRRETPSQRIGQWLSMHLLEPWLAFYQGDYALFTVLARQPWPARAGVMNLLDVRRLMVNEPDRNSRMWDKLLKDPAYAQLARDIWSQFFELPPPPGMDPAKVLEEQIAETVAAIDTLRQRGVEVILVRPPSDGAYYEFEQRVFPRARTWDPLVERAGVPGIHFEDFPDMQGLHLPEWSHLSPADAERYTEALYHAVEAARGDAADPR
ncbi:hypothetical protein [Pseudomarimonas salicorniae]|uniref:SGNH/GDSL hydrolase family protein n=1 Tax=Pseudomarimonas salicorniae TaxID=2933270 RepID=A0ABT0GF33_9GAMM|nr:hypothetical protein [Lysobacter sp. CAU 1642]MCK7593038.1 hypothetical protein [Lysobacter sp. CAU 1642]